MRQVGKEMQPHGRWECIYLCEASSLKSIVGPLAVMATLGDRRHDEAYGLCTWLHMLTVFGEEGRTAQVLGNRVAPDMDYVSAFTVEADTELDDETGLPPECDVG